MPDNEMKLLLTADPSGMVTGVKAGEDAVAGLGDSVEKSSSKAEGGLGNLAHSEMFGLSRREFSHLSTDVVVGFDAALGAMGGADEGMKKTVGTAKELVTAFAFGGVLGVAITGLSALAGALLAVTPPAGATADGLDAINKQLKDMATAGEAVDSLAAVLGVSRDLAEEWLKDAKNDPTMAKLLKDTTTAAEGQVGIVQELTKLWQDLTKWVTEGLQSVLPGAKAYGAALDVILNDIDVGRLDLLPQHLQDLFQKASNGIDVYAEKVHAAAGPTSAALAQLTAQGELDTLSTEIPKAVTEWENYTQALNRLAEQHAKAMQTIATDITHAQADAATQRLTIEQNLADQIATIQEQAAQKADDLAYNHAKTLAQLDFDRTQQAQQRADDQAKIERESADRIATINRDLADTLRGINQDEQDKEASAHTYGDVLKIRADAERRRQDAAKKATEQTTDADKTKQQQLADFNERNRLADVEFQHKQQLANQDYAHQKELADRALSDQLTKAREAAQKQLEAADTALAKQLRNIDDRKQAESAAYAQSLSDEKKNYDQKISDITDTRTAQQQLSDDINKYWGTALHDILQKYIDIRDAAMGIPGLPGGGLPPDYWKTIKGYADGGIVPGPIGMPRLAVVHGGEVVVPNGARGARAGGHTFNFNAPIYGVQDLERTIDRKLARYEKTRS